MNKLVIVESPAKCAKIQSFLGAGWTVLASMGHIRALQEKLDAVGIDRDWTPIYEEIAGKRDQIVRLKKAAKAADEVWLATDDDREGEGIAWHICQILKLGVTTTPRIVFHEITRAAIEAAVANPGRLNMSRVNAQQARAMLDMLVGFTISRVLWKRVAPRLSAGRCQTPALRLVVERDREIDAYEARNFWRLRASAAASANTTNTAPQTPLAIEADGEHSEDQVRHMLGTAAKTKDRRVLFVTTKERVSTAAAPAPLITSTLQQEASAAHGLGPKATMAAAQKLYEAGHITYMRTDNPVLSEEAATAIRGLVTSRWGEEYVGSPGQHQASVTSTASQPPQAKKGAKKVKTAEPATTQPHATQPQAAHEAIRPTHPEAETIPGLEHAQEVVYRLIWRRAFQSQMTPAKTEVRQAALTVPAIPGVRWSAEQSRPLFEGWRILDHTEKTEASQQAAIDAWVLWTPYWHAGAEVCWESLGADEIFTRPPGRFTEAMLIRELEKRGIGRPSTFASLVSTLFDREYVEKTNKEGKPYTTRHLTLGSAAKEAKETTESHKAGAERNKVAATPLGISVVDCLVSADGFADLFAYDFTAGMEAGLDRIAEGSKAWKSILQETWTTYKDRYEAAMAEKDKRQIVVGSDVRSSEEGVGAGAGQAKVVQTKKGPLLVRELANGKAEFAPLPKGITAANAAEKLTAEAVAAAFAAAKEEKEGELLGMWVKDEDDEEGVEIRKKKGPYGFYVEAGGVRIPWKDDMSLEAIVDALVTKEGAFERTVGPYILKQGPYGYYFYKKAAGGASKGKPKFVGLPKDMDPATVTEAELTAAAATAAAQPKKPYVKKTKA